MPSTTATTRMVHHPGIAETMLGTQQLGHFDAGDQQQINTDGCRAVCGVPQSTHWHTVTVLCMGMHCQLPSQPRVRE